MHQINQSIQYHALQMPNEAIKLARSVPRRPSGAVEASEPGGSAQTAALICMLVRNNVPAKCSSECSFLLPGHETSATLGKQHLRSRHYRRRTRAANGTTTGKKKNKLKNNQDTRACRSGALLQLAEGKETLNHADFPPSGVEHQKR